MLDTSSHIATPLRKRPTSSHQHYPAMDPRTSAMQQQQTKTRRRLQAQYDSTGAPLQLSSLPRFHPAAYTNSSNSSSRTSTPGSTGASPQPLSPRSQTRKSDPQRHLAVYHQTLLAQYAARDFATATPVDTQHAQSTYRPPSPKLLPLGSPGQIVTPLELEGDNYLSARSPGEKKNHLNVDSYIQQEAKRRGDVSPRRLTTI